MCCTLTFSACVEEFSPSINYGERTYINDYKDLVDAVNDLNNSLQERFDALGKLLDSGLLDIKLSIESNTGKIEVQSLSFGDGLSALSQQLSQMNATLLEGFSAIKTVARENNERLVYAINANGELVALHLDQNGQLIEATVKTQLIEVVKSLNDIKKSNEERFAALNELLAEKLVDVKLAIDAQTGKIEAQTTGLNENLTAFSETINKTLEETMEKIDQTLLNGFTAIKTVAQENNERLVYAVNANGELVALHLDNNGNLIETAIKTWLVEAVNNVRNTIEERLKALEELMDEGLADIKVSIDTQTGKITTLNSTVASGFSTLNLTLLNEFEALKTTSNSNNESLVSAINANGELITLHLDQNGQLLDATIKAQFGSLVQTLTSNQSSLSQKLEALSTVVETGLGNVEVKLGEVGDALEAQLVAANTSLTTIKATLDTLDAHMLNGFKLVHADINDMSNTITVSGSNQNAATATLQQSIIDALGELKTEVTSQGGTLATAINEKGQAITTAIGSNGQLISAMQTGVLEAIEVLQSGVEHHLDSCTTSLEDAIATTRNTELAQILDELKTNNDKTETLLNMQNGLKFSEQTFTEGGKTTFAYMFMAPGLYQAIMADPTLKKTFQNMLHEVSVPAPESGQYPVQCSEFKSVSTVETSYNNRWSVVEKAPAAVVITGTVVVDGHQWLVVRNVCEWTKLQFEMLDTLYPYTFYIEGTDAKGTNRAVFGDSVGSTTGQASPIVITLYNYDPDTGVFVLAEDVSTQTFNAKIQ